jgi:hypothetical protein
MRAPSPSSRPSQDEVDGTVTVIAPQKTSTAEAKASPGLQSFAFTWNDAHQGRHRWLAQLPWRPPPPGGGGCCCERGG